MVYNGSTKGKAWIWDVALDAQNRPVLAFTVMPSDSDHRYYYARWNGTKWIVNQMCVAAHWFPQTPAGTTEREPQYSGGIILNPQDPSEVFLSRPPNGTVQGQSNPRRTLLWMYGDYTHYTDFNTGMKYAFLPDPSSGALSRSKGPLPNSSRHSLLPTPVFPFSGAYFDLKGEEKGVPVLPNPAP